MLYDLLNVRLELKKVSKHLEHQITFVEHELEPKLNALLSSIRTQQGTIKTVIDKLEELLVEAKAQDKAAKEKELIFRAEQLQDDDALEQLQEEFDPTYMVCHDCDGLVCKKADCCLNQEQPINWFFVNIVYSSYNTHQVFGHHVIPTYGPIFTHEEVIKAANSIRPKEDPVKELVITGYSPLTDEQARHLLGDNYKDSLPI